MRRDQKVSLIVYVSPASKARIAAWAKQRGSSISQACVELINDGIRARKADRRSIP